MGIKVSFGRLDHKSRKTHSNSHKKKLSKFKFYLNYIYIFIHLDYIVLTNNLNVNHLLVIHKIGKIYVIVHSKIPILN